MISNLRISHVEFDFLGVGETRGAFHLVKNSENSGSGLNGKRFFGSPDWKIPRKSGTAQKVVPFSRLERPNGNLCSSYRISHLYHQFHTFRGLLSGQASLGSLVFPKKLAADPGDPGQVSGSFLQTNFRATTSALPATIVRSSTRSWKFIAARMCLI